jgi:uncharacterized delta-60 repeat protein
MSKRRINACCSYFKAFYSPRVNFFNLQSFTDSMNFLFLQKIARHFNAFSLQKISQTKSILMFLFFCKAKHSMPALAFILLLMNSLSGYAQVSDEWMARYNGTSNELDVAYSVAVDADGNVYVTGYSNGVETGVDYATVKYNAAGQEQWAARYNGPGNRDDVAYSIGIDGDGNVYVTGRSWGDERFDYATVKYNAEGEEQWVNRYDGPNKNHGTNHDRATSLAVDAEGNVYITGNSWGVETSKDYATIKYNTLGEEQWVARYDGPANGLDEAVSVILDEKGNIYVTGFSNGGESGLDYATIKYNTLGEEQWVARYNSSADVHDRASSLAIDAEKNVYVTGFSQKNEEDHDYATVKYNAFGEEQWAVNYDGPANKKDEAKAIAVDTEGNVFVTGHSLGHGTGNDYATVKYNALGDEQWVARYHNYGTVGDFATAMALDAKGNVYVTGNSWEDGGHDDYATIKYNTSGEEQWIARYRSQVGSDYAKAIALDAAGNVYVTGYSWGYQDYVTVKYSQELNTTPELMAPSDLAAEGVSASQINLNWQDNNSDEDGFVLERATNPDFTGSVAHIRLAADRTSYEDKYKTTDVTFYYRIKAVKSDVSSEYSAVVSATATGTPANQLPVVDAGEDKTINLPDNSISFTATASDSDGEIAAYLWEQLNGPAVSMSGLTTATLSLSELVEGSYTFEVTITDDQGATAADQVNLRVNAENHENIAPVANAGADQTVTPGSNGTASVTLDGSASSDTDGSVVSYSWTAEGEEIATGVKPTVSLTEGIHTIILTVTDNEDATDTDEVVIRVNAASDFAAPSNLTARGVSGNQINVYWEDNTSDEDNFVLERSTNSNFTGSVAYINIPVNTTSYEDRRKAADVTFYYRIKAVKGNDVSPYSNIASAAASYAASNQPPVAHAGEDLTLVVGEDGTVPVTLDGSGSTDADGSIVNYDWNVAGEEIATGISPTVNLATGTHTITLTVTDNEGATDSDEVTITVQDAEAELAAPAHLSAEGVSASQINLSWKNHAPEHDGFVLERATNPDFTGSVAYISIPVNTTSYEDRNKTTDVTFYYRVKAVKGSISSDYSNIASAAATHFAGSSMRIAGSAGEKMEGITEASLQVYPNPLQQEFIVKLHNDYEGPVRLVLFDATGRILMEEDFEKTSTEHAEKLQLSGLSLPHGVYFLKLSGEGMDERTRTIRLVKE